MLHPRRRSSPAQSRGETAMERRRAHCCLCSFQSLASATMAGPAVTCAGPGSTRSRTRTGILPGLSTRHFPPPATRSGIGIADRIGRRVPSLLGGNVSVRARMGASLGAIGWEGGLGLGMGGGRVCLRSACGSVSGSQPVAEVAHGHLRLGDKVVHLLKACQCACVRACVCVRSLFLVPLPHCPVQFWRGQDTNVTRGSVLMSKRAPFRGHVHARRGPTSSSASPPGHTHPRTRTHL